MIPLLHDFSASTVLVFGGGPVGARKARRFAREARVVVVSPAFATESFEPGADGEVDADDETDADDGTGPNDRADDGDVELIRAAPTADEIPSWIDRFDPALVVAATDDEAVNDAVASAARERGVLVNRADRSGGREAGGVVVPATIREGDVVASISTSGTAPVLSKHLRQDLEAELAGAGEMAALLSTLRSRLKERDVPVDRRREIVTDAVNSPSVWTALRTGAPNTEQVIEDVLDEYRGGGGDPQ